MPHHPPAVVGSILDFNARHFPESPALICGDLRRSNAELAARGRRLAAAFEDAGLSRLDRAAILSRNSLEFFEVYAAGWFGGVAVATVNYRLAPPEIAFIIADAGPRLLIFEAAYLDTVAGLRARLPGIERYVCIGGSAEWAEEYEAFIGGATRAAPKGGPEPDDPANLIYTSGTTGRPKGCIHTHATLGHMARSLTQAQPAPLHDKFLLVMPMFHIGGLAVSVTHLSWSGTVVIVREFDAPAVLEAVTRERIGLILLAPTMVQMLLDTPGSMQADLSSLHTVIYSASPMPSNTLRQGLARLGPIFVQYYGQTEVISTYLPRELHKPDGTEAERALLLSAGIAFPGVDIRIVDDHWRDVGPGETGQIISRTLGTAVAYWNASAASLETFRDGWTATGDIGRFDDRGFVYIVDRKKDIIISGGENVYSREVEEALLAHVAVAEAAVVGRPDPVWGEAVCAVVRLAPGASADEGELIAHVKSQIASYKKPKVILFMETLPKLVSGKVDKTALRRKVATPCD